MTCSMESVRGKYSAVQSRCQGSFHFTHSFQDDEGEDEDFGIR